MTTTGPTSTTHATRKTVRKTVRKGVRKTVRSHDRPGSSYAEYLRAAMAHAGLLQQHVVNQSERLSKTTLSLILSGKQDPRCITNMVHEELARVLRVPMASLLEHAGYDLYDGAEIPPEEREVAKISDLQVPRVRSLADIADMPEDEVAVLLKLVQARHRPPNGGDS